MKKNTARFSTSGRIQQKDLLRSLKIDMKKKKKLSLSREEQAQLSDIEKAVEKIELDGSSGIHNYSSIEEMLTNFKYTIKSLGGKSQNEEKKFR